MKVQRHLAQYLSLAPTHGLGIWFQFQSRSRGWMILLFVRQADIFLYELAKSCLASVASDPLKKLLILGLTFLEM